MTGFSNYRKFYLYQMKKLLFSFLFLSVFNTGFAQTDDPAILQQNAKRYMQQGDYANATVILIRASEQAPFSLSIAKDLALCYYMQNDNTQALKTIQSQLDKGNADEQAFQIEGMVYKRMQQPKDADKVYKKALKLYPGSGPLYNDYGELLWSQQDFSAINMWEKGIKEEPSFPGNYYNAAKYYFFTQDKIWGLIYGEIFVNIESHSARTAEIKNILLEGYKKLFSQANLLADNKNKNKFETAFLEVMNKQNDLVIRGLNAETLTMIRTRFILNWYQEDADEFPFRLFDSQKQMLENGLFTAYNQWIFGASQSLSAFQNWTQTNSAEYNEFNTFMQQRTFTPAKNQYYH